MKKYNFAQPERAGPHPLVYISLISNVAIVALVAFLVLRPVPGPTPPTPPEPPRPIIAEDVPAIVVQAEKDLATYEAEISEQIAQAVMEGRIASSQQLVAHALAAQEKAEDMAFAELNRLNNKYISAKEWNKNLVAEFQRLKAEGKREIAK